MSTKPLLRMVREPSQLAKRINAYSRGYDRGLVEGCLSFRLRAWASRVFKAALGTTHPGGGGL